MRTHLVAAIGLTLCAALLAPAGCASEVGSTDTGEETATVAGAMNMALAPHYYAARPNRRWCQVAPCQGYFLQELNSGERERLVMALDFSGASLDDGAIGAVYDAPLGDLVLRGAPFTSASGVAVLGVRAAFRGLPGVEAAKHDAFYVVSARDPRIECFTAPCNNLVASRLETGETVDFTALDVDRAAKFRVDQTWLEDRILHHGAVVAGHFRSGDMLPGGPERLLDVGQAYLRLPDRGGPCMMIRHLCYEGYRAEYTRNLDRCHVFQGCAQERACLPSLPLLCPEGYTLARWAAAGPACYATACDPSFLAE